MKLYSLHTRQQLPITMDAAWEFFSDPANLKVITPESMGFSIRSGTDKKMYAGQIIEYVVTPLWGIPTKWVTEITQAQTQTYFIDEQRFGPYSLWHHTHFFKTIPGGVEIEDIVRYKLPFGFLGQLAHPLLVKPKLKEIFEYRKEKLETLFGKL